MALLEPMPEGAIEQLPSACKQWLQQWLPAHGHALPPSYDALDEAGAMAPLAVVGGGEAAA